MRQRRAWRGHTPQCRDVDRLLRKYPETTMMAISRQGVHTLNLLAVEALFGHAGEPLVTLDGDMESNSENYLEDGSMKAPQDCQPLRIPCFEGMKLFLTKNVDKDRDYVNGMRATVESFHRASKALYVITDSQHRLAIRPWTDVSLGNRTYCPIRFGYASTVIKMAGAELPHAILWLDRPHVPGAAYTGMSRVAYGSNLLLGGNLSPEHFTPARL